jgi:hypothetical protein
MYLAEPGSHADKIQRLVCLMHGLGLIPVSHVSHVLSYQQMQEGFCVGE